MQLEGEQTQGGYLVCGDGDKDVCVCVRTHAYLICKLPQQELYARGLAATRCPDEGDGFTRTNLQLESSREFGGSVNLSEEHRWINGKNSQNT